MNVEHTILACYSRKRKLFLVATTRPTKQSMICAHQLWWRSPPPLAASSPTKNLSFSQASWPGPLCAQWTAWPRSQLHSCSNCTYAASAPCVAKGVSLSFLCDRDFSSAAGCRLSLHTSQLLYNQQSQARAAHKPRPFPNTAHWDLKEKNKRKKSPFCWFRRGSECSVCGFFPILKRQNKLK